MKSFLFSVSLLLAFQAAGAKEIECPIGTLKEPKPFVAGKKYETFCFKDADPTKKIKHGPYQAWENVRDIGVQYELVLSGHFTDGSPTGLFEDYYPNGKVMAQFEVSKDLSKMNGKFKKFHPDGSVRAEGQFENDKGVGVWKFYSPDGKLMNSGTYEQNQAVAKKFDDELAAKEEQASKAEEAKNAKAQAEYEKTLKKNWSHKTVSGVKIFTNKQTKLSWSDFMGSANWLNATLKCRKNGMKLATSSQLALAIENGLMNFIENQIGLIWTSEDKSTVADSQMSLTMENHEALVVSNDGQVVPQSKLDDLGIVCVK